MNAAPFTGLGARVQSAGDAATMGRGKTKKAAGDDLAGLAAREIAADQVGTDLANTECTGGHDCQPDSAGEQDEAARSAALDDAVSVAMQMSLAEARALVAHKRGGAAPVSTGGRRSAQ